MFSMRVGKAKDIIYLKEMNLVHDTMAWVGQKVTILYNGFHCIH